MKPPTNLMTLGVLGENVAWGDLATLLPLAQLLHQPEKMIEDDDDFPGRIIIIIIIWDDLAILFPLSFPLTTLRIPPITFVIIKPTSQPSV